MQSLRIFLLAIGAAVVYGILHDQITARICVEYFTEYHPPVFGDLQDPTLLGIGWGFAATWWVGAILGIPLALAAQVGNMPKRSAASMIRPIAVLLCVMAACAALAGIAAYFYGASHPEELRRTIAIGLPPEKRAPFLADWAAHLTSYGVGFLGGMVLIGWTIFARYRALLMTRGIIG